MATRNAIETNSLAQFDQIKGRASVEKSNQNQTGDRADNARFCWQTDLKSRLLPPPYEFVPNTTEIFEWELALMESNLLSPEELVTRGAYFSLINGQETNHYRLCLSNDSAIHKGTSIATKSHIKAGAVTQTGTTTPPTSQPEAREKRIKAVKGQRNTEHPGDKICNRIYSSVGTCGLYYYALEYALEHLHENGVRPSSLFDAKTGGVTEMGRETIAAATEEGWSRSLSLAEEDMCGVVQELGRLLGDRSVFDYVWADLVQRGCITQEQAKPQIAAAKLN